MAAYTPAETPLHDSTLLESIFMGEFEKSEHVPNESRFAVKFFQIPELRDSLRSLSIQSDASTVGYPIERYFDYRKLAEDADKEAMTKTLAQHARGAYDVMVLSASEKYGVNCGVLDWKNNLRFVFREFGPSVSDPCGEVKSIISYNFKFVACPNRHIPRKKITAEILRQFGTHSIQQEPLNAIADKINEFFA
jgi:hypothetical protein